MRPINEIAKEVQRAVGIKNPATIRPIPLILKPFIGGHSGKRSLQLPTPGTFISQGRKGRGRGPITNRRIMAHEIAHNLPGMHKAIFTPARDKKLTRQIMNWRRPKRIRRVLGTMHGRAHGPEFKAGWRHVEKIMKRIGAMKKLRIMGYEMYAKRPRSVMHEVKCPKCGRTFYREKPFRWPMECPACHLLLSEVETKYGYDPKLQKSITKVYTDLGVKAPIGKGLHTPAFHRLAAKLMSEGMERNFAYATAMKKLGGKKAINPSHQRQKVYACATNREYNMIQYVKDPKVIAAIAEVKAERIRQKGIQAGVQRTAAIRAKDVARSTRAAIKPTLEARLASGVGRFVKRHSGLLSLLVAAPAIASEIQRRMQKVDTARATENYAGLGGRRAVVAKLVGRAQRKRKLRKGILRFPAKHPKLSMVAGGAGLGAWAARRQQQQPQPYALEPLNWHTTPKVASKALSGARKVGGKVLKSSAQVALGGLISWIAISILQELERKRIPAIGPYMPDVVPDIELARYTINQVVACAEDIPEVQLYAIQDRARKALSTIKGLPHKAKVGTEKGLLMWLLGFISAEILGRGITTPKRRIRVEGEVPVRQVKYDQRHSRQKGTQPFDPSGWAAKNKTFNVETQRMVKDIKRERRHATLRTVTGPVRRHPGRAVVATLPWMALAGLIAARRKRQKEQKYFAAGIAAKGAVKASKWAIAKKAGNIGLTAWIASDLISAVIPRKKRKPGLTSVQTSPAYRAPQYYAWPLAGVGIIKRLKELRWVAQAPVKLSGRNETIAEGLLEVANRIKAERMALAAAGVGVGVGGVAVGKKLERRRIRKAIG